MKLDDSTVKGASAVQVRALSVSLISQSDQSIV